MCEALSFSNHLETVPPVERPRGSVEQSVGKSTQVQTGAAHQNRHVSPLSNLPQHEPGLPLVIAGREDLDGLTDIDHVMRKALPFFESRLGSADIHLAENLDRVVV